MKLGFAALALWLTCAGCAGGPPVSSPGKLSGEIVEQAIAGDAGGLTLGFVADSQLQTRRNFNLVPFYRGRREDEMFKVSIRPPALDWAARSILQFELDRLAESGAKAIFYLGDGANNGCYDEFALGFEDGREPDFNDRGILRLLADFRKERGVPVYFVLGNHDILGAGSTSKTRRRSRFCEDPSGGHNLSLLKLQVIGLVERFNRGNDRFGSTWRYRSSFDATRIEPDCGSNPQTQHRRWGCYLAATLEYGAGTETVQFLLLDTTDFASVSKTEFLGIDQEGLRGALSFGSRKGSETLSQTRWFGENASEHFPLRIAVSHYDIPGLRKNLHFVKPSRKSQRFADLFLKNTNPIKPAQDDAYVVTAHTHNPDNRRLYIPFNLRCGLFFCRAGGKVEIGELNIGSTTDYSNYATLVKVTPAGDKKMRYQRVDSEPPGCSDVWASMAKYPLSKTFRGEKEGWAAVGISQKKRSNYHDFLKEDLPALWANLSELAQSDQHRAKCIGLYAAAVEEGGEAMRRLPPE